MGEERGTFPLVDRSTPIVDRVKERRKKKSSYSKFGADMGKAINGDLSMEELEEALGQFNDALAEEIGEDEEGVAVEITRPFSDLIMEFDPEGEESESSFSLGSKEEDDEEEE